MSKTFFVQQVYIHECGYDIVDVSFGLIAFGKFPKKVIEDFITNNKILPIYKHTYYSFIITNEECEKIKLLLKLNLL